MSVVRQTQTVNTISRITQRTTTKVTAPQTLLIATQMKVRNRRSPSSSTATVRSVHKQTQPGFSSLFSAGGAFSVDSFSVFCSWEKPNGVFTVWMSPTAGAVRVQFGGRVKRYPEEECIDQKSCSVISSCKHFTSEYVSRLNSHLLLQVALNQRSK